MAASQVALAGLFDDDEARRAILDLRARVENNRQEAQAQAAQLLQSQAQLQRTQDEANAALRRSVLELQNQIEALRSELARMRGHDEQLDKNLSEVQQRQKDLAQGLEERLRVLEPVRVQLDGREFMADRSEKREYDQAFELFRGGDFPGAAASLMHFLRSHPKSGYTPSALFWLGNAQFANKDYRDATAQFRSLLAIAPDHAKAAEAALGLANSQIELKETRAARKTLEDVIKTYPQSEAASAAADRLARLR